MQTCDTPSATTRAYGTERAAPPTLMRLSFTARTQAFSTLKNEPDLPAGFYDTVSSPPSAMRLPPKIDDKEMT
jgi:hypothetical protein